VNLNLLSLWFNQHPLTYTYDIYLRIKYFSHNLPQNVSSLTTKSSLYDIFEQCETDVNDVGKFFYIINGGMLLRRLKCKKKNRFINVLCKKLTENNFQCGQAESDADHLIGRSALDCVFPHVQFYLKKKAYK
jgi:hypothetical protein